MVPTDDAMITRQMLYSALPVPETCAMLAIGPPPPSDYAAQPRLESRSKSAGRVSTFPINSVAKPANEAPPPLGRQSVGKAPRRRQTPPPLETTPKNKSRPVRDA